MQNHRAIRRYSNLTSRYLELWFQISIRCANQSLTEFILFFIVEVIGKREIFRRFADAVSSNRQSCLRIQPPASKCDGSGG